MLGKINSSSSSMFSSSSSMLSFNHVGGLRSNVRNIPQRVRTSVVDSHQGRTNMVIAGKSNISRCRSYLKLVGGFDPSEKC